MQLDLDVRACAEGIRRVAGAEMIRALRVVTVQRGIDPRRYALMAFGGAGGLHAAQIADELGIDTILCPRASGVLAALGLVVSPRRRDVQRRASLSSGDELTAEAIATDVERTRGRALARRCTSPTPSCTPCTSSATAGSRSSSRSRARRPPSRDELRDTFESEHEERYGYRDTEQELELVTIRVTATAAGVDVELAGADEEPAAVKRSTREATLGGETLELDVVRGIPAPGTTLEGPAVVELPESTLLIPAGWSSEVDHTGTIRITRSS